MSRYTTLPGLVEMIRRATSPKGRRLTGLYAIEGTRLVERALRAGAPLEAVLVSERLNLSDEPRHRDLIDTLRSVDCQIVTGADDLLDELTEGRDLGPVLGLVRLPEPTPLASIIGRGRPACLPSSALQPGGLDRQPGGYTGPPLLAAVDIVDPGNVGALVRTAHAAGAGALLACGASDPFHPRAVRTSRGSIFKLPVITYATMADLLTDLAACHVCTVATAAAGGTPLPEMVWPETPVAFLMGNEAEGLPAEIATAADYRVTIPMAEGIDSFSVNAAAAIVLYTLSNR